MAVRVSVPSARLVQPCGAARARRVGSESRYVDNWQAFGPGTRPSVDQPEPSGVLTGAEERSRTLSLIDFLADYHARRNPPVYDIGKYGLFLLRDSALPGVPGVSLTPASEAWLTVDFLDLPARPEVPAELVPLLGDSDAISPHTRPAVPADPPERDPGACGGGMTAR